VKISKLDILVTSFHLLYMIIFHWPWVVKSGDQIFRGTSNVYSEWQ
jgi:hypothetical protein